MQTNAPFCLVPRVNASQQQRIGQPFLSRSNFDSYEIGMVRIEQSWFQPGRARRQRCVPARPQSGLERPPRRPCADDDVHWG